MPAGLRGLVIAGVLATTMGSLSTALNSLATSYVRDFHFRWFGEPATEAGQGARPARRHRPVRGAAHLGGARHRLGRSRSNPSCASSRSSSASSATPTARCWACSWSDSSPKRGAMISATGSPCSPGSSWSAYLSGLDQGAGRLDHRRHRSAPAGLDAGHRVPVAHHVRHGRDVRGGRLLSHPGWAARRACGCREVRCPGMSTIPDATVAGLWPEQELGGACDVVFPA